jgi:hypothetical protein
MAVTRMSRREVRGMIRKPRILQKFYIYDPNVAETLGGLQVLEDRDEKGSIRTNTRHVLAVTQQVQWWIDQGLMGEKPVGEISDTAKKLLAQVTRGRSEDNEKRLPRIPRYDRSVQSGAPVFAGQPASSERFKARQQALRRRNGKRGTNKERSTSSASTTTAAPPPTPSSTKPTMPRS